jgi:hypothetical protein
VRHPLDPLNGSENVARERASREKDATIRRLKRELREARRALKEVVEQCDHCEFVCENCGVGNPMRDLDLADVAREALRPKPAKKTRKRNG